MKNVMRKGENVTFATFAFKVLIYANNLAEKKPQNLISNQPYICR